MLKHLLILIIPLTATSQRLELYYSGKIELDRDQIVNLSNDNIQNGTNYQKALGYYQLGIIDRSNKENLKAWQHYDDAYLHLKQADTTDYILESAILRNQGAIAADYQLHEQRVDKYSKALQASKICDKLTNGNYQHYTTRAASTLYNLGRAQKDAGDPAAALLTFEQLKKSTSTKYRTRAYRETAMLMKEMEKYAEAEANFYQAEKIPTTDKMKMWVYHDWASLYKDTGDHQQEEEKLKTALTYKHNFRTLMDLGECLMRQERKTEAVAILEEAAALYPSERKAQENVKVFDYLAQLTDEKVKYLTKSRDELHQFADKQVALKEAATSVAFANALKEIERNRVKEKRIALLVDTLINLGIVLAIIGILFASRWAYKRHTYKMQHQNIFSK